MDQARQCECASEFIRGLCEEYLEEAGSLWHMRRLASRAPHYDLNDLLEADNRLEAQVDTLRVAGAEGWEVCKEHFQEDEGTCFAAAVLAFESADEERISLILEKAADPELSQSIISALQWLSYDRAEPHIRKLLKSDIPARQAIGLSASVLHGRDPGPVVNQFLTEPGPQLRTALLAVGLLGRKPETLLSLRLQKSFGHEEEQIRFAAAWSAARMGDKGALDILKKLVKPESPDREQALGMALRRMEPRGALAWQKELAKTPGTLRLAVKGAGIIGDPALIPWLLEQMSFAEQARAAGESLTFITGLDIKKENLEGKWPEGFEAGPNDDPADPNVEPDPDEFLPWPDRELTTKWLNKNKNKYPGGTRLLMGKPITKENIAAVLQTGTQTQRAAAAMEAALRDPLKPVPDIYAPAWRQLPPQATAPRMAAVAPNYGPKELVITAVNCITPLGLDGAMTAASVRAGISRFAFHADYKDASGNPIIISRIKGIGIAKIDITERLGDYAEICLENLLAGYFQGIPERARPSQGHLILGIPFQKRHGPDYGDDMITNLLLSVLGESVAQPSVEIVAQGNASLPYALGQAARHVADRPTALCVIGGIDSLLRKSTLNWFARDKRLKSASYGCHQGLCASESVCFLVVESIERAKQAKRPILARISALGLAQEPVPRASNKSGIYTGLTEACQSALKPLNNKEIKAVFGDLNGDDRRAEEWAVAGMRCFKNPPGLPHLWTPAELYGDIGAAGGAVMAAIVSHGYARNWLESPVMTFCSDDHGACGAIILEKECE